MSKKRKHPRRSGPAAKHAPPKKKPKCALPFSRHPSPAKSARTPSGRRPSGGPPAPVPFKRTDRVLLLGEGDFSFSASLVRHHGIRHLTATSYDSESQLVEKYPQALENIAFLRGEEGVLVAHGVDAGRVHKAKAIRRRRGEEVPTITKDMQEEEEGEVGNAVAEELRKTDGGRTCGFGVIGFMFPHVGGKSTDVDRQIRANQQLLLSFFNSSKSLLSPTGTVVTTLFEGNPYDLWAVRALAKSAGFRAQCSFRFSADMYPGYSHARTIGNIRGDGGWKGEERNARTYIFELDNDRDKIGKSNSKKKRPADCSSSSDESTLD